MQIYVRGFSFAPGLSRMVMTRLLRFAEVMALTGVGRTQLYRKINSGDFPQPVRVGPKSIRFLDSDIQGWIDGLPRRDAIVDLEREYGR